jgi:hypothetical protein
MCVCGISHVEMGELKVGFNHMRQKPRLHSKFHCECEEICGPNDDSPNSCLGSHAIYLGITKLWPLYVLRISILSVMPKIICLGHVIIMVWII